MYRGLRKQPFSVGSRARKTSDVHIGGFATKKGQLVVEPFGHVEDVHSGDRIHSVADVLVDH